MKAILFTFICVATSGALSTVATQAHALDVDSSQIGEALQDPTLLEYSQTLKHRNFNLRDIALPPSDANSRMGYAILTFENTGAKEVCKIGVQLRGSHSKITENSCPPFPLEPLVVTKHNSGVIQ